MRTIRLTFERVRPLLTRAVLLVAMVGGLIALGRSAHDADAVGRMDARRRARLYPRTDVWSARAPLDCRQRNARSASTSVGKARYLAALMIAELPYAVGTVLLGVGFVERDTATLVAVCLVGTVAMIVLARVIRSRRVED